MWWFWVYWWFFTPPVERKVTLREINDDTWEEVN